MSACMRAPCCFILVERGRLRAFVSLSMGQRLFYKSECVLLNGRRVATLPSRHVSWSRCRRNIRNRYRRLINQRSRLIPQYPAVSN